MKIVEARIYALSIPLTQRFRHALAARSESDSVIVQVVSDSGVVGYGEGVPRVYVTGETQESCMTHIQEVLLPRVMGVELHDGTEPDLLAGISGMLPEGVWEEDVAYQAARTAVELALVDCILRSRGTSLASLLPPSRQQVVYSAVIGIGDVAATTRLVRRCMADGFDAMKLKVATPDDVATVSLVRELIGPSVSLRLDANGAFGLDEATAFATSVAPFDIACMEQPLSAAEGMGSWTELCMHSPVPIMADERVVTFQDAEAVIAARAVDMINLRLSKCGGLHETLRMYRYACTHGIGVQLGCQVGESCILSAAGRHVAAHVSDLLFVEGSYGENILSGDLSRVPLSFGKGGRGELLVGLGLGADVEPDRLDHYSRRCIHVG